MKKLKQSVSFGGQSEEIPELAVRTPWISTYIWCLKAMEPWPIYPTTQFQFLYLQNEVNITNLLFIVCYMDQIE